MIRKSWVVAALVVLNLGGIGVESALAQTPHTHQHSFSGAEHWARVFDDPARDEWQKPHPSLI